MAELHWFRIRYVRPTYAFLDVRAKDISEAIEKAGRVPESSWNHIDEAGTDWELECVPEIVSEPFQ